MFFTKQQQQQQQQQQPFYGPLSGTTQVSWYQKKHSPTHHPDHHPIFISFFHLPRFITSSLFKFMLGRLSAQLLSKKMFLYLYKIHTHILRLCSAVHNYIPAALPASQPTVSNYWLEHGARKILSTILFILWLRQLSFPLLFQSLVMPCGSLGSSLECVLPLHNSFISNNQLIRQ